MLVRELCNHCNITTVRRAVWNQWTGLLDYNTGLEYWNGLNCYKKLFLDMTAF